jgi:hypothetical protein
MPMPCKLCHYEDRATIERQVSKGMSYREAGHIVGCDHHSIAYHFKNHVAPELRKELEIKDPANFPDVVAELNDEHATALEILQEARDAGDHATAIRALDASTRNRALVAKLTGAAAPQETHVNLTLSPQYIQIKTLLLQKLSHIDPVLRDEIAGALLELDEGSNEPNEFQEYGGEGNE